MAHDHDSFESVYAAEHEALRNWLARQTRPDIDADDLAAEIFTRAYRGWDGYRGEASRRSWLWRIAHNTLKNWRRSRARDRSVTTGEPPEEEAPPADVPTEQREAVWGLLGHVQGETARTAVYLRYVEGRTIEEVAEALDLTPTAVTSLTYRALRAIRRDLERGTDA